MTETTGADEAGSEVAYYYPEPYWRMGEVDPLKTLLLFFDEIAILLPRYMRGRETAADPVLAGPLQEQGLLRVLEPEVFIDQQMTEDLSEVMVELITGGAFDDLEATDYYVELSRSRMGWDADVGLAGMVIEELEARQLARPSQDGVSVPLHPTVRTTVLVVLSQLARAAGRRQGLNLHPTTGRTAPVAALVQTLARAPLPSAGHIVALDLETVTVNLATVPLDEVLEFRREHGQSYRQYARDLRHLLVELGPLSEQDRERLLLDRQEDLADQAADLRRTLVVGGVTRSPASPWVQPGRSGKRWARTTCSLHFLSSAEGSSAPWPARSKLPARTATFSKHSKGWVLAHRSWTCTDAIRHLPNPPGMRLLSEQVSANMRSAIHPILVGLTE